MATRRPPKRARAAVTRTAEQKQQRTQKRHAAAARCRSVEQRETKRETEAEAEAEADAEECDLTALPQRVLDRLLEEWSGEEDMRPFATRCRADVLSILEREGLCLLRPGQQAQPLAPHAVPVTRTLLHAAQCAAREFGPYRGRHTTLTERQLDPLRKAIASLGLLASLPASSPQHCRPVAWSTSETAGVGDLPGTWAPCRSVGAGRAVKLFVVLRTGWLPLWVASRTHNCVERHAGTDRAGTVCVSADGDARRFLHASSEEYRDCVSTCRRLGGRWRQRVWADTGTLLFVDPRLVSWTYVAPPPSAVRIAPCASRLGAAQVHWLRLPNAEEQQQTKTKSPAAVLLCAEV